MSSQNVQIAFLVILSLIIVAGISWKVYQMQVEKKKTQIAKIIEEEHKNQYPLQNVTPYGNKLLQFNQPGILATSEYYDNENIIQKALIDNYLKNGMNKRPDSGAALSSPTSANMNNNHRVNSTFVPEFNTNDLNWIHDFSFNNFMNSRDPSFTRFSGCKSLDLPRNEQNRFDSQSTQEMINTFQSMQNQSNGRYNHEYNSGNNIKDPSSGHRGYSFDVDRSSNRYQQSGKLNYQTNPSNLASPYSPIDIKQLFTVQPHNLPTQQIQNNIRQINNPNYNLDNNRIIKNSSIPTTPKEMYYNSSNKSNKTGHESNNITNNNNYYNKNENKINKELEDSPKKPIFQFPKIPPPPTSNERTKTNVNDNNNSNNSNLDNDKVKNENVNNTRENNALNLQGQNQLIHSQQPKLSYRLQNNQNESQQKSNIIIPQYKRQSNSSLVANPDLGTSRSFISNGSNLQTLRSDNGTTQLSFLNSNNNQSSTNPKYNDNLNGQTDLNENYSKSYENIKLKSTYIMEKRTSPDSTTPLDSKDSSNKYNSSKDKISPDSTYNDQVETLQEDPNFIKINKFRQSWSSLKGNLQNDLDKKHKEKITRPFGATRIKVPFGRTFKNDISLPNTAVAEVDDSTCDISTTTDNNRFSNESRNFILPQIETSISQNNRSNKFKNNDLRISINSIDSGSSKSRKWNNSSFQDIENDQESHGMTLSNIHEATNEDFTSISNNTRPPTDMSNWNSYQRSFNGTEHKFASNVPSNDRSDSIYSKIRLSSSSDPRNTNQNSVDGNYFEEEKEHRWNLSSYNFNDKNDLQIYSQYESYFNLK